MEKVNEIINETLTLDSRKRLQMTSVLSVDGFNEECLKLTVNGTKVEVKGTNIKITSYNKNSGNLTADGNFFEIKYGTKKEPIFRRIFK